MVLGRDTYIVCVDETPCAIMDWLVVGGDIEQIWCANTMLIEECRPTCLIAIGTQ